MTRVEVSDILRWASARVGDPISRCANTTSPIGWGKSGLKHAILKHAIAYA